MGVSLMSHKKTCVIESDRVHAHGRIRHCEGGWVVVGGWWTVIPARGVKSDTVKVVGWLWVVGGRLIPLGGSNQTL